MHPTLTSTLLNTYPRLYGGHPTSGADAPEPFLFLCGDGWFDLLYRLSAKIESECRRMALEEGVAEEHLPVAVQVKEKFGALRFYLSGSNEAIRRMIEEAERQSKGICETCGAPGKHEMEDGLRKVLCETCRRDMTIRKMQGPARPEVADCRVLPSDYSDYGGKIERWADDDQSYPDCSGGCRYFAPLYDYESEGFDLDFGVCLNPASPRHGLLTFEHQAGQGCFDDYTRQVMDLRAQMLASSRESAPAAEELASWQEFHDTDDGRKTWVPKALYEEYRKYDLLQRFGPMWRHGHE